MKFGMLHLFENPSGKTEHQLMKEQLDIMRAAEDCGFDSVWPAEHHFTEYGYCASTAVILAAVAAVTKRIRLGTGVVVLPFHNPIRVAEEFAMLDLISDGRLDFGVGRGYQPVEFKGYQVDQTKSREIFNESMEVIMQAWTQERVSFKGVHFNFEGQQIRPKPLQKPHPPVWMACLSPDTFALAGQKGYNLLCAPVFGLTPEMATRCLTAYRQAVRARGEDPAQKEIATLCMVYCAETKEQVERDFANPVIWYWRTFSKYVAPPAGETAVPSYEVYAQTRDLAASISFDQLIEAGMVIGGNPDQCIEQISKMKERFGATQFLSWTRMGGLDHRKVLKSMDLMQKYVIPHFRQEERRAATAVA